MSGSWMCEPPSKTGGRRPRLLLHRGAVGAQRILNRVGSRFSSAFASRRPPGRRHVLIQCGQHGLALLEYEEIVTSAREFFGAEAVSILPIKSPDNYIRPTIKAIRQTKPTHLWVDPRTGSQSRTRGPLQSLLLSIVLAWHDVTPIVWLTDVHVPRWRLQAELIAATSGRICVMAHPALSDIAVVSDRVVGPLPLPVSRTTIERLRNIRRMRDASREPRVIFIGSVYPPREQIVREVVDILAAGGIHLEVIGREVGGHRISNDEYWHHLATADVVLATALPARLPGQDPSEQPHLVFKFSEALAAGAALVIHEVPGAAHLFEPNIHFVPFQRSEEAAAAIAELCSDQNRRMRLSGAGTQRLRELAASGYFWERAMDMGS